MPAPADATTDRKNDATKTRRIYLYVFVEMDGLVIDVVPHEEVVDTREECHLRQREYVHELFHSVAMYTLQDRRSSSLCTFGASAAKLRARKCANELHLAIEVAHNLKRNMGAFIHGDDFLVRHWMKTSAKRERIILVIGYFINYFDNQSDKEIGLSI